MARILTIMGSGETSPTMVKVHRSVLEKLGGRDVGVALLDTPFGFQENADELCAKAGRYFAESLSSPMDVVHYRHDADRETITHEAELAKLRAAPYVFAGPGSPTYALRLWSVSLIPDILVEKLHSAGAVTFASAAAVTIGVAAAPIYEIYKVGEDPRWCDGLDLTGKVLGMSMAVIPHFNNAEGGTHDTRYCYLGERRLSMMEEWLAPGTFVLGIDEHTGIVFDLDASTAEVVGIGCVTVRARGCSHEFPSGSVIAIDEIGSIARQLGNAESPGSLRSHGGVAERVDAVTPSDRREASADTAGTGGSDGRSPLLAQVEQSESAFRATMACSDFTKAVEIAVGLEKEIAAWASETFAGNERELARSALHGMILSLGTTAEEGNRDPREVVAPFVDTLLDLRSAARAEGRFDDSDRVRDVLVAAGIEVHDVTGGTEWNLR